MKQQLQEKEELIKTLQTQLSQTQAEQAAQVGDGTFIRIKDHGVQSGVCGKSVPTLTQKLGRGQHGSQDIKAKPRRVG